MVKATYKRKHLIGGLLTDSEDESMTIVVGAWHQAGRHGVAAVSERSYLLHRQQSGSWGQKDKGERERRWA